MRVGVVGPCQEDDFAANILAGLADLGIPGESLGATVSTSAPPAVRAAAKTFRRHRRLGPLIERSIARRASEREIDLVVSVESLRPETVRELGSTGARVALWFPDAVSNLGSLWMFDAPYDGLFFKEPALVRQIRNMLNLPIHYLPEACNPSIHRPIVSSEATGKIAVVGNMHPLRLRLLERLVREGLPLALYGPRPAALPPSVERFHTGRYVRGVAKSAVFASAAAVLNNLHPAEVEGVNCRLFEATAAGGAVVSEQRPALGELFEIGTEVLAYTTYEELVESLSSLVESPSPSRDLRAAASRRSLGEYTYAHRLTALLDTLG